MCAYVDMREDTIEKVFILHRHISYKICVLRSNCDLSRDLLCVCFHCDYEFFSVNLCCLFSNSFIFMLFSSTRKITNPFPVNCQSINIRFQYKIIENIIHLVTFDPQRRSNDKNRQKKPSHQSLCFV